MAPAADDDLFPTAAVAAEDVDLFAPFERDIILEVRTSRMKTMPGLTIQSGIDKIPRTDRIPVSFLGLEADEHDPTFHGGVDKAVHGYCSSHYPSWRAEFPGSASRFRPGGFGENLVTARMNERNVCIGDVVSVGDDGLLLQVSLPRQPCFKLNHRFQLKNFAPNTYKLSRTGWYYRVLREGSVQVGDEIRLVERKWPQWTIERIQEYLHRKQDDEAMNEELSKIDALGAEARGAFCKRVAKAEAKKKRAATAATREPWRDYQLVEKKMQTARVVSLVLEAISPSQSNAAGDGDKEPQRKEKEKPLVGAHARIRLPNGLVRTYSVVDGTESRFQLGIALAEDKGRGGSAYLHRAARVGDVLQVGGITADVKPASMASNHIFIAGGIGVTAFLAMVERARSIHLQVTLHWAVRSAEEDVPFRDRVAAFDAEGDDLGPGKVVRLYDGSRDQRMEIPRIFQDLPWNSHVYVCGPKRMMEEARHQAEACGLGDDEVHYEAFEADTGGDPFEVEVDFAVKDGDDVVGVEEGKKKKKTTTKTRVLRVGEEETLLEVLKRELDDDMVPSSCEVGNCGTCKVGVKRGRVDHRGTALTQEEKCDSMLSCVSRGIGRIAIEV
ncbi:hypothetical protein SLS62_008101 [Diatrype stigma]|uniref:Uncharacterized protein n=1 Tax=Diatrype stigma TaxID=117547 RepID=A0AAN9UMR2_9PEZI